MGDGTIVDGTKHSFWLVGDNDFLMAWPNIEHRVIAMLLPDMENVVIGVHKEIVPMRALQIVESRDRCQDQDAGTNCASWLVDDDAKPVACVKSIEQLWDGDLVTINPHRE